MAGVRKVNKIGSKAELMGTTTIVIQANKDGGTVYPNIGMRNTALDGIQHKIFVDTTRRR